MRCDFLVHSNSIDKLSAVAPPVRRLDLLREINQEWKPAQFRVAASKCDNLAVANLNIGQEWGGTGGELAAFFDSPKPNLRELALDLGHKSYIFSEDLVTKISASATNLRSLTIRSTGRVTGRSRKQNTWNMVKKGDSSYHSVLA